MKRKKRSQSAGNTPPPVASNAFVGETHVDISASSHWFYFFLASLIVGAILRVSFGGDIEFKYDEWFMFNQTQQVGGTQPFPTLGMESGVGVRNPPMSIWIFLGLGRVFAAKTPPQLAKAVQILNILALAGLLLFAYRRCESSKRDCWLWAFALVCVNPLAIYLQRKIWAQSTLPVFCVLLLWAWSQRNRRGWAWTWGLVGMWLGQIHMSGFIFTAAVVVWTAASEALGRSNKKTAWLPWAIGSGMGLLTMLTWLYYFVQLNRAHSLTALYLHWFDYPVLHSLYWQLWLTGPLGLGLSCTLGNQEFLEYLKYPLIAGHATWLMGLAHLVIFVLAGTALVRCVLAHWRTPINWQNAIFGRPESDTLLLVAAAFFGYGILLTLNVGLIPRHYLLITFPLEWVWWMLIFKKAFSGVVMRRMLVVLWACELMLSIGYLGYIHVNHGATTGDYGVGYQYQIPVFAPRQR